MNWNHVWELFKINLLYANPQAVTNLQKRQEKKKKANFSIVNAMLRQQLLILIVFTVVYSYLFVGVDYKANPGVLTLYLLTFSVMGLLQTFTALYSTFYDSKDQGLSASSLKAIRSLFGQDLVRFYGWDDLHGTYP